MRGRKPSGRNLEPGPTTSRPGRRKVPQSVLISGRPQVTEYDEPPESLDPDAQDLWLSFVPELARAGVIDRVDVVSLEMLCVQGGRAIQARRVIAKQGLFEKAATGMRQHPALKLEREATTMFLKLAEH